jgi:hypothetical protein
MRYPHNEDMSSGRPPIADIPAHDIKVAPMRLHRRVTGARGPVLDDSVGARASVQGVGA